MRNDLLKEADISLNTTDTELLQGTMHCSGGIWKSKPPGGDLDQQGIIMGRDDRPGVTGRSVKAHPKTSRRAISLDRAEIRSKVIGWILSSDPALDCITTQFDIFLALDAKLRV